MDFSSMILRPALDRITSSFASTTTNSYGGFITRVLSLSFTGSFNDRTSLLQEHDAELVGRPTRTTAAEDAAAPPPPPAEPVLAAVSAAPATTVADHMFDIEAGTTTTPAATDEEDDAAEWRRVGKSVQPVCLFVASASLVLFANLPNSDKQQQSSAAPPPASASAAGQHAHGGAVVALAPAAAAGLLYIADMAFISLGFFCSLGLSMFSVVARRPGAGEAAAVVARAQKSGMVVAVASVVVAFSLRVCMMLAVA